MDRLDQFLIPVPIDWHLHLRDGKAMQDVLRASVGDFGGAMVMPNLVPPVTSVEKAMKYQKEILGALPPLSTFTPYMTLYLTDNTSPHEIRLAKEGYGHAIKGVKLYPAGATTNSDAGVTNLEKVYSVLEVMEEVGMPLQIHGEVVDDRVDVFDREKVFIERTLALLLLHFPKLRIVFEHVTTKEAVNFVLNTREGVVATITAHHLWHNRNALFKGGLQPDNYCLPVLKSEEHRLALIEAATSGDRKFFLGTDSAPHAVGKKYCAGGCAGCYSAPVALSVYAEVFERDGALQTLEDLKSFGRFMSLNGASFYGVPPSSKEILFSRGPWTVRDSYLFGGDKVTPFLAGQILQWDVGPQM